MKISSLAFLPALLALTAACASTTALPKGQLIGQEMKPQTAYRFAVVDANPKDFFDKTVLVEASVKAVCQNSGCWMQVEDEGRSAFVHWETGCGGEFAFPKDAAGKRIVVQGTFHPKKLTDAEVEHLEEEAGHKLTVRRDGYEFNASSVLIIDS